MSPSGRLARLALAGILLTCPRAAEARTIQITVGATIVATHDGLRVEIRMRNDGDEPAINLKPVVLFDGSEIAGPTIPSFGPATNETTTVSVPSPGALERRGVWPVFVRIGYQDGAQHPFEAVHVATLTAGGPTTSPAFAVKARNVRLRDSATLTTTIESAVLAAPVHLTFFAASSVGVAPRTMELAPNIPRSQSVTATVTNLSATPSSRMPVFVVGESDVSGVHETVVAVAAIDVQAVRSPVDVQRVLIVLVGALVLTWMVVALPAMVRGKRRHDV